MSPQRKLNSWIAGFCDYTKNMGVPSLWRKWAAISAVSGALERRVVLRTAKGSLAPNVFVLLVSPPGAGKSVIISVVYDLWSGVKGLSVAPSSTTRAGLIDFLAASQKVDMSSGLPVISHSALCASSEFGNLVPIYDNAWLNILNDLYDCGKIFSDMTRKHGEIRLEHPHLCILAGTQPKYLDNLLPDAAFGMGFTSRLVMVYSGEGTYTSLFSKVQKSTALLDFLRQDLTAISKLQGEFQLDLPAQELWERLASSGFPPKPIHSKLSHYTSRRSAHMLKLMMCLSASERSDLKITQDHVENALSLLVETEAIMPQIFQEMSTKGYADANEELLTFVRNHWNKTKAPIPEATLVRFLVGKVPNNQIKSTIDLMVHAGQLKMTLLLGKKSYTLV